MTTSWYLVDALIGVPLVAGVHWLRHSLRETRRTLAVAERMLKTRIVLETVTRTGTDTLVDITAESAYAVAQYGGPVDNPLNTIWLGDTGPGVRLTFRVDE